MQNRIAAIVALLVAVGILVFCAVIATLVASYRCGPHIDDEEDIERTSSSASSTSSDSDSEWEEILLAAMSMG